MWIVSYAYKGCFKENKDLLQKFSCLLEQIWLPFGNWGQIHLLPKVKSDLRGTDFHESSSRRINFCGRLLYQIISKSDEKCRNIGEIFFKPVSK